MFGSTVNNRVDSGLVDLVDASTLYNKRQRRISRERNHHLNQLKTRGIAGTKFESKGYNKGLVACTPCIFVRGSSTQHRPDGNALEAGMAGKKEVAATVALGGT